MIERTLAAEGVVYSVSGELGASPPDPFPLADERPRHIDRLARALEAMWLDGRLLETDGGFRLPWGAVYDLDETEAQALDLPTQSEEALALDLRTIGAANADDFHVRVRARHPVQGILPDAARRGPAFQTATGLILAPREALPLFAALDTPVPKDITGRLRHIGEVKKAAHACGAALDPFLTNEDIVVPDALGVETEVVSPTEVILRPVLEGEEAQQFSGFGRHPGPTRAAYSRHEAGRHRRIVLDPEQREAADDVRSRGIIRGPDVPRFFTNPQAFLPEQIDLSLFSRRVKGLIPRKYTSQPYVRAQTSSRDWFTISVEVELASEVADLGPDDLWGPETADTGDGGADETGIAPPQDEGAPQALSPDQYAELCRQVVDTGEPFVLHEGSWVEIEPEKAASYLRAWEALERDEQGQLMLPKEHANLVLDVIDNLEELLYAEEDAEAPEERTFLDTIPEYPVPTSLRAELMPHQLVGYRWIRFLQEHRIGGLLADDMGLGKTIQVISFLAHLADRDLLAPTLIVLPAALIENWHREIRKFCPDIRLIYHHVGADRYRDPNRIALSEIVLTTYQTLLRDQLFMGQIDWRVVVSDEAQYVKNPTAQSTAVLKAMKAPLRLALTGTPVENGLSELWCIVDFVQPGRLGSQREFRNLFEVPIRDAPDDNARMAIATRLQERLTPHYVRRIKEDVLEGLPPKTEQRFPVAMGDRQRQYYGAVIRRLRAGEDIPIAALGRLIQIASHPEVFRPSGAPLDQLVAECPKLQETLSIVERVQERGEKVLIYTHYKRMQTILQELLEERFQRHVPIINGEVPGTRRLKVVDRFNSRDGFAAMLLAPQAAGVGLNITGANHVIHYTRLWNPAKEGQATDRAHRLGQERPVTVYYPIVEGDGFTSVEERLDELLADKRELARNVVWPRSGLDVSSELQAWLQTETVE